jgi:hypothetical protein
MEDLKKTTFIIPLKIEHADRYRNAKTVLGYLNNKFTTNVIIYEVTDNWKTKMDFLSELKNLNIDHILDIDTGIFHRTRYLNLMLSRVKTPVVVNYDIDVILTKENYIECQNDIINGISDVIYPYEFGMGQVRVFPTFNYELFSNEGNYDIKLIDFPNIDIYSSEYGHCIFFNTDIYKKYGAENENFISYGPEDKERGERFKNFMLNVSWKPGYKVFHFEHSRGNDSNSGNPHFHKNWEIYEHLKNLYHTNQLEYREYYTNPEYSKSYKEGK